MYEFNNQYLEQFEKAGMKAVGHNLDTGLVEIVEIPKHRWFVGVQFHPEFDDATVRSVLEVRAEQLEQRSPGFVDDVRARLHPVPQAPKILHNFLEYLAQIPRR